MKPKRLLACVWLATFAAAFVICVFAFEPARQATIILVALAVPASAVIAFVIGTLWSLGQVMGGQ